MKAVACVVAYIFIGCMSLAYSARNDFQIKPGQKLSDTRGIEILVLMVPFWPAYLAIKGAFFIVDHMPSSVCSQ